MLKICLLLTILLNSAYSRGIEKDDICKNEGERLKYCTDKLINEMLVNKNQMQYSTAIPDTRFQKFDEIIACIGKLECNGYVREAKFILESSLFSRKQLEKAANCIDDYTQLHKCVFYEPLTQRASSDILECAEEYVNNSTCEEEEKEAIMRTALVQHDVAEVLTASKDTKQFDEDFDQTLYL